MQTPKKMKVAQISKPGGDWELVERDIPEPGPDQVRVKPLVVSALTLLMGRRSITGSYSGTARDSQDTLEFSALSGVHPMIEKYPLARAAEAYEQMHSGKVRFRAVLTM